jgi:hypothetical protein
MKSQRSNPSGKVKIKSVLLPLCTLTKTSRRKGVKVPARLCMFGSMSRRVDGDGPNPVFEDCRLAGRLCCVLAQPEQHQASHFAGEKNVSCKAPLILQSSRTLPPNPPAQKHQPHNRYLASFKRKLIPYVARRVQNALSKSASTKCRFSIKRLHPLTDSNVTKG